METRYEQKGFTIIIDFVKNGEVYYRKFKGDEWCGAFRMPESDFRSEIEKIRAGGRVGAEDLS